VIGRGEGAGGAQFRGRSRLAEQASLQRTSHAGAKRRKGDEMDWSWVLDSWSWWTTARVAATAAVLGAIAALAGAFSGIRTLRQSRRDSKARNRPMVAAELRDVKHSEATQILVIRNYGPSIARNVLVSFVPPIPDPEDPSTSVTPFLKNRYSKVIPVLTPGMELDNLYYVGTPGVDGRPVNSEPTPDRVTVRIHYESDHGDDYEDEFPLDTNLIRDRTYAMSSTSPGALRIEMARSLQGIHQVLKRVQSQSGKRIP
jgi:hypothetical protein